MLKRKPPASYETDGSSRRGSGQGISALPDLLLQGKFPDVEVMYFGASQQRTTPGR